MRLGRLLTSQKRSFLSPDGCGIPNGRKRLQRVRVAPRHHSAPDVGELMLCRTCVSVPTRAWRWRWRPLDPALALNPELAV